MIFSNTPSLVKGLGRLVFRSSSLGIFALLLIFTACNKEENLSSDKLLTKEEYEAVNFEQNDATVNDLIKRFTDFNDNQLRLWRAGENTDQELDTRDAIDNMEGLINMRLASGRVYKDEKFLTDSIDVPSADAWNGEQVAGIFDGIKSILIKQYESIEGDKVGFRFVDLSDIKVREDGTSVLFVTGNVGTVKAGERALRKISGSFLWGTAETDPFPCFVAAEPEIANAFNFQKGCLMGNPAPPSNGVCGFFLIRTVAVTPSAGTPGVPVDLIRASQSYPSGNTQASSYPNEGQFVWHFDADQDENCFSFLKTNNYVFNQLKTADGPILADVRSTFGIRSYETIGESLFSEKRNIVFNGVPIVTFNAHLAFIYYGLKFIIINPIPLPTPTPKPIPIPKPGPRPIPGPGPQPYLL